MSENALFLCNDTVPGSTTKIEQPQRLAKRMAECERVTYPEVRELQREEKKDAEERKPDLVTVRLAIWRLETTITLLSIGHLLVESSCGS